MKLLPSPLSPLPLFCLLLLLAGCQRPASDSKQQPVEQPLKGLKLRLTVVNDPALAAAAARARGEWTAETGSNWKLSRRARRSLLRGNRLPGDAVVCPAGLLGNLAEREWLVPVPKGDSE